MDRFIIRSTVFIVIMFFLNTNVSAQISWNWQNPLPQGNHLNDIQAVTAQVGFAAGNQGAFLRTNSGGVNWGLLSFPSLIDIGAIQFLSENQGWIVGSKDSLVHLFRTSDGGGSWEEQIQAQGKRISAFFLNENDGWVAVDSSLYQTRNGGSTWEFKSSLGLISQIYFLGAATGWAVGGSNVYRTTDGGNSWQSTKVEVLWRIFLYKVKFVNSNVGWLLGSVTGPNHLSGHLLKTTDGGLTWEQQLQVGGGFDYRTFTDIEFQNEMLGWAVATRSVFRTLDGGDNWEEITNTNYPANLTQITTVDDLTLWGGGYYGALFNSSDGGANWTERSSGTIENLEDMRFLDENVGFVSGAKTLLKTTDGGQSWGEISIDFNQYSTPAIWFNDSLLGVISCIYTGGLGGIYKTVDGGRTWTNRIDKIYRIFDFYFLNGSTGWAVGAGGVVYQTEDGGDDWIQLSGPNNDFEFYSVHFASPDTGWGGGYIGLQKTTDAGHNWSQVDLPLSTVITDIFFVSKQLGWIVGNQPNTILRTTDGGETWEIQSKLFHTGFVWRGIHFQDQDHGWVVGNELLKTSNGGNLWERVSLPTDHRLRQVQFANNNGWIIGDGGTILHTLSDRVVSVKNRDVRITPDRFVLHQNYPNPFNPSTQIRYGLPVTAQVSLRIFNTLGQRVRDLMHEKQQTAGIYTVEWDGKDELGRSVSSGVYFYRLDAKAFSALDSWRKAEPLTSFLKTYKMVLVR